MSDDTRDIAIAVRADLANLSEKVVLLSNDVKALTTAHQERIGAEKMARWIIGFGGGAVGASIIKASAYLSSLPVPK